MTSIRERWSRVSPSRWVAYPEDRTRWGAVALLAIVLLHLVRYVGFQVRDAHTYSDGYYSWLFARSLAFDADLDLTNDYAICGDPFRLGVDEGAGRPANPFYFGPATILAPVLFVVRHLVKLPEGASVPWKSGCSGPWLGATGLVSPLVVGLTALLSYRLARRWFDERSCTIAAVVIAFASPLNVFGTLTWYYSHLYAAFAVALALLLAVRATEVPMRHARWLLAGLAVGYAALMRIQEGSWGLVPLTAALSIAAREVREPGPKAVVLRRTATRLALLAAGFVAVFSVQLFVYQRLYGSPFVIPQGRTYVQLGHAHPWLLLFGARSGMLYWTPLLWLSVIGIVPFVMQGKERAVAISMILVSASNFFIASAALSWTGAATLGARVQTSLAAPLLVTAAATVAASIRVVRRRRLGAGALVAMVCAPWILVTWWIGTSGVANDRPVPAPELYGQAVKNGFQQVYPQIGNPWILPASLVFAARYRAPLPTLDVVASDGMFVKDYKSLTVQRDDTLVFAKPPPAYWSTGFGARDGETVLEPSREARVLLALYWPWVTSVRITAHALDGRPATLRVRTRDFWGRTRALPPSTFTARETLEVVVPAGAFDSGINEIVFTSDAPLALVSLQWIDRSPHDTRVRMFGGTP